jgi:hypothetical protein
VRTPGNEGHDETPGRKTPQFNEKPPTLSPMSGAVATVCAPGR